MCLPFPSFCWCPPCPPWIPQRRATAVPGGAPTATEMDEATRRVAASQAESFRAFLDTSTAQLEAMHRATRAAFDAQIDSLREFHKRVSEMARPPAPGPDSGEAKG